MHPPHQGNQGVVLFDDAVENQKTLSITFVGTNIWTARETEQHQHELQNSDNKHLSKNYKTKDRKVLKKGTGVVHYLNLERISIYQLVSSHTL